MKQMEHLAKEEMQGFWKPLVGKQQERNIRAHKYLKGVNIKYW